jgi:hypothetical protein
MYLTRDSPPDPYLTLNMTRRKAYIFYKVFIFFNRILLERVAYVLYAYGMLRM